MQELLGDSQPTIAGDLLDRIKINVEGIILPFRSVELIDLNRVDACIMTGLEMIVA